MDPRDDRGQTTTEWLGLGAAMLAIFVAIGYLAPAAHQELNDDMRDVACSVIGVGRCGLQVADPPPHPRALDASQGTAALDATGGTGPGAAVPADASAAPEALAADPLRGGPGTDATAPSDPSPGAPSAGSSVGDRVVDTGAALSASLCRIVGGLLGASTCAP